MLIRRATIERILGALAAKGYTVDDPRFPMMPDIWVLAESRDIAALAKDAADKIFKNSRIVVGAVEDFIEALQGALERLKEPPASVLVAKAVEELFAVKPEKTIAGREYKEAEGKTFSDLVEERLADLARLRIPVVYIVEADAGYGKYTEEAIGLGSGMLQILDNVSIIEAQRLDKVKTWALMLHAGKRLAQLEGNNIHVAGVTYQFRDRRDAAYNYFKVSGRLRPFVASLEPDLEKYLLVTSHYVSPSGEPVVEGKPRAGTIEETEYTPDINILIEVTNYPHVNIVAYYEDYEQLQARHGDIEHNNVMGMVSERDVIYDIGQKLPDVLSTVNMYIRKGAEALRRVEAEVTRAAPGARVSHGPLRFVAEVVDEKHGAKISLGAEYHYWVETVMGMASMEAREIPEDVKKLLTMYYDVTHEDDKIRVTATVSGDADTVKQFLVRAYKEFKSVYIEPEVAAVLVAAANAARQYPAVREKIVDAAPYSLRVCVIRAASLLTEDDVSKAYFFLTELSLDAALGVVEARLLRGGVFKVKGDGTVVVNGRSLDEILRVMGIDDREVARLVTSYIARRALEMSPWATEPSPEVARLVGLDPSVVTPRFLAHVYGGKPVWAHLTREEKQRYIEAAEAKGLWHVLQRMLRDQTFKDVWSVLRDKVKTRESVYA